MFVDGTKIEANANKYTFVWKKATDKFETRLQEKIKDSLKHMKDDLGIESNIDGDKVTVDFILNLLKKLEIIKSENDIKFVKGKGNRKSVLQKYYESFENFIEKQSKYDLHCCHLLIILKNSLIKL